MLILIAGLSGSIGKRLTDSALDRGHQVRGLGRSPENAPSELRAQLEDFIITKSYYDIPAIDEAMKGVYAVVCAYAGRPELQLEGQLVLLWAAERAGIKRFHTASWNYDWRHLPFGADESYDPYLCFRSIATLTSTIKPIYMFTGAFAEVYFSVPGHGDFSPNNKGEWDPESKSLHVWGDGEQVLQWTTENDAAEFSIEAVTGEGAEEGGEIVSVSGLTSLNEIARVYQEVRGKKVEIVREGIVEDLERDALKTREEEGRLRFWEYIGYSYSLQIIHNGKREEEMGFWKMLGVKRTSLKEFLEQNPGV